MYMVDLELAEYSQLRGGGYLVCQSNTISLSLKRPYTDRFDSRPDVWQVKDTHFLPHVTSFYLSADQA